VSELIALDESCPTLEVVRELTMLLLAMYLDLVLLFGLVCYAIGHDRVIDTESEYFIEKY
jgi:hypothetical protein